jgi:hypothetical protein
VKIIEKWQGKNEKILGNLYLRFLDSSQMEAAMKVYTRGTPKPKFLQRRIIVVPQHSEICPLFADEQGV